MGIRVLILVIISVAVTSCHLHYREPLDSPIESVETNTTPLKTENVEPVKPDPSSPYVIKYAAQMKTTPEKLYNPRLYETIDEWIGVKYKWAGMDKNGVDCSGFANIVYKDVYGYQLKRSAYDIIKDCNEIPKEQLMEGDFVFFDISSKNSHIGIYLSNNKFVHASTSKGVIISDLNESYWTKYWGRAGRIK